MALNLSKKDIEEKIKNQIALEVNCLPEDFDKNENMITTACQSEKRRKFSDKPFFLQMATFGKSTVISADDSIHPWLTEWVKGKQGIWLFEQHNYYEYSYRCIGNVKPQVIGIVQLSACKQTCYQPEP